MLSSVGQNRYHQSLSRNSLVHASLIDSLIFPHFIIFFFLSFVDFLFKMQPLQENKKNMLLLQNIQQFRIVIVFQLEALSNRKLIKITNLSHRLSWCCLLIGLTYNVNGVLLHIQVSFIHYVTRFQFFFCFSFFIFKFKRLATGR